MRTRTLALLTVVLATPRCAPHAAPAVVVCEDEYMQDVMLRRARQNLVAPMPALVGHYAALGLTAGDTASLASVRDPAACARLGAVYARLFAAEPYWHDAAGASHPIRGVSVLRVGRDWIVWSRDTGNLGYTVLLDAEARPVGSGTSWAPFTVGPGPEHDRAAGGAP